MSQSNHDWKEDFAAWLEETGRRKGVKKQNEAALAWRDLLEWSWLLPWEIETSDVADWVEALEERGLSYNTICRRLASISAFYRFRFERRREAGETSEGETAYDPAKEAPRPKQKHPAEADYLSAAEAQALLGAIDREESAIGARDYALILTHLASGLNTTEIRHLKWGDLEREGAGWVVRRRRGERLRLEDSLRKAIQDSLEASGRLKGIQEEEYIFAPAADALNSIPGQARRDWRGDRPLSRDQMHWLLKRYAAWAGLDERRITYHTLRHTAVMLRLERGESFEEVQKNMDSMRVETVRRELKAQGRRKKVDLLTGRRHKGVVRRRKPKAQPGNLQALRHGLYARKLQAELKEIAVEATGDLLDGEITALRYLMRQALAYYQHLEDPRVAARLGAEISAICMRVGEMVQQQGRIKDRRRERSLEREWDELMGEVYEGKRREND